MILGPRCFRASIEIERAGPIANCGSWLGADPDRRLQKITLGAWCTMVTLVMIFGVFIALVAFLIASGRNKRESR